MNATVIIPTYNERESVSRLLSDIASVAPELSLLVIDDNSPDGTGEMLEQMKQGLPQLEVIHRPGKLGLASAYIHGFRHCLRQGDEQVFTMDGDYSHQPDYLPLLQEALDRYDVVVGSRYADGISVVNWPLRRVLLSQLGSYYIRAVTGLKVADVTSGFMGYRRSALKRIDLDRIHSDGYAFLIEVKFRCQQKGGRIGEVPIVFHNRHSGQSKISKRIVVEALAVAWWLRLGK